MAKLAANFEQDSDARNGLPETMETVVNNGVDPSVSLMDANHDQELVYDEVVEPTESESVEQQDEQQDEQHVEESDCVDDMVPSEIVPAEPRDDEMDDLMGSFRQLAVNRPLTSPHEDADERGIPEDYGENGAVDTGALERTNEADREAIRYSAVGHRVMPTKNLMDMFRRDRRGAVFLNRNYDSVGGDWSEYVLNISVNEALRTRGKDAEVVILKELSQMIEKKVWTPVECGESENHQI